MKSELLRRALMAKMAIGGNLEGGDDKNKSKTRKIGQSGVDLTEDIIINKDPTQIPKDVNYGGWNAFQNYLKKQTIDGEPFIGNPRLNTTEGKQLGQNIIDTFNSSDYVKKFPQNKITPEQVQAVQQYHKLADPKVQTEGWFGSQTSRMRYPQPTVSYMEDADRNIVSKEGYVPVMWGNKQYVAPAASTGSVQTYEIYDPKKHSNLLQKPIGKGYKSYSDVYNQFVPKTQEQPVGKTMSTMANGGNVGGDNPNADVNLFTKEKFTPQQWSDYAKKQGWELFETELTAPMEEQIKRGKYFEYVNPKEYTRMPDGRLVKTSDVGKTVDYKGDLTYKPIISYGYKDLPKKEPTIESKPKGSEVLFEKQPNIYFSGKDSNVTTFVKKGQYGQMDTKVYKDNKTGKEIDYNKSFSEGGKYNPVFIEGQQNAPIQPKNKSGVIGSFKRGGGLGEKLLKGLKQVGSTAYGVGEGLLDTATMGATDQLTDQGFNALQDMAGSTESEKREQESLRGYGSAAGAVGGAILNPASVGTAIGQAGKGLGQGIKKGSESSSKARAAGDLLNVAGQTGNVVYTMRNPKNQGNPEEYATGGTIKGAGTGTSDSIVTDINGKGIPEGSFITPAKNNEMAKGIRGMVLNQSPNKTASFKKGGTTNSDKVAVSNGEHLFTPAEKEKIIKYLGKEILEKLAPEAEENNEMAKGGMLKRADGSYSKKGLWDNIRENAGSGKKPTTEMLKQEEKIKAELKKGGYVVKRSSERKGKTHVVTGPDGTKKYFGDSNLGQHPNNPARKKAFYARHEQNLKKNPYFRAFARETWADGGTVGSTMEKANGGNVTPADKTKVKSPNVYEGKIGSNKSRTISTMQEYRETKRNDGTSKVEVKMPDGTWKTTYNLEKKYETVKKAQGGELSKEKAKTMLHDKKVHGKPLTDKQRKYFGWVAGGKKSMGGIIGKYANGGAMNRDWEWG